MHITSRQLNQIRGGRKTQIRVPVQQPRNVTRTNGTSYTTQPFAPAAGVTMTLREPPPRKDTDDSRVPVHVTVTAAFTQTLNDIQFPDVLAEGHPTTSSFQAWWVQTHDRPWVTKRLSDNATVPDEVLLKRFADRHADRVVWAIKFEISRGDRPRLLVPSGRKFGDEHGYTDNPGGAMADEPEAVDRACLTAFAEANNARFLARRAHVDEQLLERQDTLEQRLQTLRRLALERGIDTRSELRLVERGLNAIDRKIRAQTDNRHAA